MLACLLSASAAGGAALAATCAGLGWRARWEPPPSPGASLPVLNGEPEWLLATPELTPLLAAMAAARGLELLLDIARLEIVPAGVLVWNAAGSRLLTTPAALGLGFSALAASPIVSAEFNRPYGWRAAVAVGAGVGSELLPAVRTLAQHLDANLITTRGGVWAGLAAPADCVGISARRLPLDLYVALGVSGAPQHMAGIEGQPYVVAINSDPRALVFKHAHLALTGDLEVVLAELLAALENPALSCITPGRIHARIISTAH